MLGPASDSASLGHAGAIRMTNALLDSAVLTQLCEDLAPIIAAEIAAGNVVDETVRDWPASVSVFCRVLSRRAP